MTEARKNSPGQQAESLWTKNLVLIVFLNLFIMLAFQMLNPVMPVLADRLGGSGRAAGLVVGVFTISSIFMRPIAGMLADRRGRKVVFIGGLILFAACTFSYIWVSAILFLLAVRFVHGFAWGTTSTAATTIATDAIPKARLGEGMGYVGLAGTLAMAIAPALGLTIAENFGLRFVFPLSFACIIACFVIACLINYQEPQPAPAGTKNSIIESKAIFPGLIILLITMTYGSIVTFIALYAEESNVTGIGLFFTVYAIAVFIARPLFGRLSDRKGYSVAVIPGIIAICCAMLLLYNAAALPMFCLAGFVYGLGFGATQSALMAMAVRDVSPARRGAANATFFVGFDVGIGMGAILWGTVAEITGYRTIYALAIIPAAIAMGIFLLNQKPWLSQKSNIYEISRQDSPAANG